MERKADPAEAVLEALIWRGWRFRDSDDMRSMIRTKSAAVDTVEAELLNMDLRSLGGKSLPDPSAIKKSSHLQGPKVLQLVSVRDIYQSSIDASFRNSQHRRLLRFILTDGHSEVTAVEYASIPSITEEIIPGIKVRLENKIVIHNGILCLNPKVVTIMGGLVQSLYEEWQMSQKYSGFSRSSLSLFPNANGVDRPPFEKLQIEAQQPGLPLKFSSHMSGKCDGRQVGKYERHWVGNIGQQSNNTESDKVVDDSKTTSSMKNVEDKPCSSEARPKEVSEAVPVQNQAAAQKLLQKMNQPMHEDRYPRGQRHRSRGKEEEAPVFTLDEWERRKSSSLKTSVMGEIDNVSRDEEIARQLQNQLDFEDFQGRAGHADAAHIRMSMFSFGGTEERWNDSGREFRRRGRGRGRGRGRRFG